MRIELLLLALAVGLATWAFRVLPTRLRLPGAESDTLLRRLIDATGPAALVTLFVASVLPYLAPEGRALLPLACGTGAVLAAYWRSRSVVLATLAGALAYGLGALF